MTWALAKAEKHQRKNTIKRFDPRFWTINFPRPMMGCIVTSGPDSLRADLVFYRRQDLAGLIWEAKDRWDHPLLAYETAHDFSRCTLSFRWRSQGVKRLDAVHGPTLTIEGRDAAGNTRNWYVRLWNYASRRANNERNTSSTEAESPEDAVITLDFANLAGGFLHPAEADPVFSGDIDRIFFSCVPNDYDASKANLVAPVEAWVEISAIKCTGSGSTLAIGDVAMPEHGAGIANGYDDSTHLTPARVVRMAERLGYRGDIVHYVGMSHYARLEAVGNVFRVSLVGGVINTPCEHWHRSLATQAAKAGLGIIWSLSYELFNDYCWGDWKQRDANGAPALTGWKPPSTLLSPAHAGAMRYLRLVAQAFVAIDRDSEQEIRHDAHDAQNQQTTRKIKFQVGEPWWWINPDGQLCAYDVATKRALGTASVAIADVRGALTSPQKAMLDALGNILANSTQALVAAARSEARQAGILSHLLIFLPTVLDSAASELKRCNVPLGWRTPAFDVLQIEDYDWVTAGRGSETERASLSIVQRLGYPIDEQHYFAGFVLNSEQREHWKLIADAADKARKRGVKARFIWALTQVARDGFILLPSEEDDDVQAFDNVDFPIAIGRGASVAAEFSTQIIAAPSGHEQRASEWANARMRYDAGPGIRSESEMRQLISFFRARRGAARAFRLRDPIDYSSAPNYASNYAPSQAPSSTSISAHDQHIGTGNNVQREFSLVKHYGEQEDQTQIRRITHPVAHSLRIAVDQHVIDDFLLGNAGVIVFETPPAKGSKITAGFLFDVPVRFAEDRLDIDLSTFLAGEAVNVPLIEVRQS